MAPNLEITNDHLSFCLRVDGLHHSPIQQLPESFLWPWLCGRSWEYIFGPWEHMPSEKGWKKSGGPVLWGVEWLLAFLFLDPHCHSQTITHPSSWKKFFSEVSLIWPIKPTRFRGATSIWLVLKGWAVVPAEKDEREAKEGHLRQSKERSNMFLEFYRLLGTSLSFL